MRPYLKANNEKAQAVLSGLWPPMEVMYYQPLPLTWNFCDCWVRPSNVCQAVGPLTRTDLKAGNERALLLHKVFPPS